MEFFSLICWDLTVSRNIAVVFCFSVHRPGWKCNSEAKDRDWCRCLRRSSTTSRTSSWRKRLPKSNCWNAISSNRWLVAWSDHHGLLPLLFLIFRWFLFCRRWIFLWASFNSADCSRNFPTRRCWSRKTLRPHIRRKWCCCPSCGVSVPCLSRMTEPSCRPSFPNKPLLGDYSAVRRTCCACSTWSLISKVEYEYECLRWNPAVKWIFEWLIDWLIDSMQGTGNPGALAWKNTSTLRTVSRSIGAF